MKRFSNSLLRTGLVSLCLAGALHAHASVVVGGTRIVYQAPAPETTVKLNNDGTTAALTQAWIDKGDIQAAPTQIDVPFTVMPPIARIDPGKGQSLRIFHTGEAMPQDRESLFWLNVLEIPPKPSAELDDKNLLMLAIRTRIKLFYRPAGLKGSAQDAPSQITWRIGHGGFGGQQVTLEGRNPSAYHVTLGTLELTGNGKAANIAEPGMLAPGETRSFPLTADAPRGADARVKYTAINDYGGPIQGESALSPAAATAQ